MKQGQTTSAVRFSDNDINSSRLAAAAAADLFLEAVV
jgi:hypothetical protein